MAPFEGSKTLGIVDSSSSLTFSKADIGTAVA